MLEVLSNEEIMREYSLKDIIRYNTRSKIKEETVADHTCFVSILSLKILAQLGIKDDKIIKDTLVLSVLHDIPESCTSDVPYDVKQKSPELRKLLERLEDEYYDLYWGNFKDALEAKDGLPGLIVKLADVYSVFQFCYSEISLGNSNEDMKEIFITSKRRIRDMIEKINAYLEEHNGWK